jgi:hypothetical protein
MKNILLQIQTLFNNIKNFINKLFTNLIKIINNRINQDCLGKILYKNIINKINIKIALKNIIILLLYYIIHIFGYILYLYRTIIYEIINFKINIKLTRPDKTSI